MIYIAKHKPIETPIMDGYEDLNMYDIKNKDNIAYYETYASELVATYDIWKNHNDDIKGLVHYRRFFLYNDEILTYDKAKELLNEYDIITTERYIIGNGIYPNLRGECRTEEDAKNLDRYYQKLINKIPELKEYFLQTSFNPRNMIICKKEIYDKYCEWFFTLTLPILNEWYNEEISKESPRMVAYLIERLMTYWIQKGNYKVLELPYSTTMDRLGYINPNKKEE